MMNLSWGFVVVVDVSLLSFKDDTVVFMLVDCIVSGHWHCLRPPIVPHVQNLLCNRIDGAWYFFTEARGVPAMWLKNIFFPLP